MTIKVVISQTMSIPDTDYLNYFDNAGSHKIPQPIFENIFAFGPNRETGGNTSYLIVEKYGNILLDCPPLDQLTVNFLKNQGGVAWLVLSGRGAISKKISHFLETFQAQVVIQEQEAYLLPQIDLTPFVREFTVNDLCRLIWTPGHSPGASCLYYNNYGGVLFTGRHLLPNSQGELMPMRTAKTFHWFRQLNSIKVLQKLFTSETLNYVLPGANVGALGSQGFVSQAVEHLAKLDLEALANAQIFA